MRNLKTDTMNKTKTTAIAVTNDMISDAVASLQACVQLTETALQNACANALEAGLHLLWLKQNLNGDDGENRVPRGTRLSNGKFGDKGTGFKAVLEEVGLPRRTAYRWMDATRTALYRTDNGAYLSHPGTAPLPAPRTEEREEIEAAMRALAKGMSLSRLQLGAGETGDVMRMEVITTKLETAEDDAERTLYEEAMDNVEMGKWSLSDAMRALGSKESAELAKERRSNVVYCDIDARSGNLTGLLPKALASLANGLRHWPDMPTPAKAKFREEWKTLVSQLPEDF